MLVKLKHQIPNNNNQIITNIQIPMIKIVWEFAYWILELIWNLRFAYCDFIYF
jgi:hypothetical protein